MNSYELSRAWFDWCFENPEKIKPIHTAIYFFAIEHCNRLGWKEKFGFPTTMVMEAIGVKSYTTYIKALNEVVDEFGFIKMIERSKNQHSANVITLSKSVKATGKSLDKALVKHGSKQHESTSESTVSINKQDNKEQKNKEQVPTPTAEAIDFDNLLKFINKSFTRKFQKITQDVQKKYKARLKDGYTSDHVRTAILNCKKQKFHQENNYQYCTPEYFSRSKTLETYSNTGNIETELTPIERTNQRTLEETKSLWEK